MKRLTLFCGHYGSGKTNIAVNYALRLHSLGYDTVIADLDIVNPYFRTKDSEEKLRRAGVSVISLPFANTNVDLPTLPSEMYSVVQNRERHAVIDVGGDDSGAYAVGGFAPAIREENNFENLYVVNFYRPLTVSAEDALCVMREVEAAGGVPVTGIVNNSNLGEETAAQHVIETFGAAQRLSELSGVPVAFTSARRDIAEELSGHGDILPLELQEKYWK